MEIKKKDISIYENHEGGTLNKVLQYNRGMGRLEGGGVIIGDTHRRNSAPCKVHLFDKPQLTLQTLMNK